MSVSEAAAARAFVTIAAVVVFMIVTIGAAMTMTLVAFGVFPVVVAQLPIVIAIEVVFMPMRRRFLVMSRVMRERTGRKANGHRYENQTAFDFLKPR